MGHMICHVNHCVLADFTTADMKRLTVGFSDVSAPSTGSRNCWSATAAIFGEGVHPHGVALAPLEMVHCLQPLLAEVQHKFYQRHPLTNNTSLREQQHKMSFNLLRARSKLNTSMHTLEP